MDRKRNKQVRKGEIQDLKKYSEEQDTNTSFENKSRCCPCCKKFLKNITNHDLFGTSILGNNLFKTCLGGIISLLIKVFLIIFIATRFRFFFVNERDIIMHLPFYDTQPSVQWQDAKVVLSPQIKKLNENFSVFMNTREEKQFVNARFVFKSKNLLGETEIVFDARPCKSNDFQIFRNISQNLGSFLCPDFNNQQILLQDTYNDQTNSRLEFQILRCDQSSLKVGDLPCKNQNEISNYLSQLQVEMWFTNQFYDFEKQKQSNIMKLQKLKLVDPDKQQIEQVFIHKNILAIQNTLLQFGQNNKLQFYNFGGIRSYKIPNNQSGNVNLVYTIAVSLDHQGQKIMIINYDIFQFLSDIGGVLEILILMFSFFIKPINEFSFIINTAQQLFYVRTTNSEIFNQNEKKKMKKNSKIMELNLNDKEIQELQKRYKIKLGFGKKMCLFIMQGLRPFLQNYCWDCIPKNYKKLLKFYENTKQRLKIDLDVIKVIKNQNSIKTIINCGIQEKSIKDQLKFKLDHFHRNVVDIDTSRESLHTSYLNDSYDYQQDTYKDYLSQHYKELVQSITLVSNQQNQTDFKVKSENKERLFEYARLKIALKMYEHLKLMQERVDNRKKQLKQKRHQKRQISQQNFSFEKSISSISIDDLEIYKIQTNEVKPHRNYTKMKRKETIRSQTNRGVSMPKLRRNFRNNEDSSEQLSYSHNL